MSSTYYTKTPGYKPTTMYLKGQQSFSRHREHEQSTEVETWPIVSEHLLQQPRSQAERSKTLIVTVGGWWKRAWHFRMQDPGDSMAANLHQNRNRSQYSCKEMTIQRFIPRWGMGQEQSVCLACVEPWVQSQWNSINSIKKKIIIS